MFHPNNDNTYLKKCLNDLEQKNFLEHIKTPVLIVIMMMKFLNYKVLVCISEQVEYL